MKAFRILMLTAAIALVSATLASAHTFNPRVERREWRQHSRIQQGARSGQLTRGERRRLVVGQRHVFRMERRAGADGWWSRGERARLEHAQDRQSRRIYRLKHNRFDG